MVAVSIVFFAFYLLIEQRVDYDVSQFWLCLLFKNRRNFPFQKNYVKGITSLMHSFIWLLNSLIISLVAFRNCHVLFTLLSGSHSQNIYSHILFNYLPVLGKQCLVRGPSCKNIKGCWELWAFCKLIFWINGANKHWLIDWFANKIAAAFSS